MEKASVAIAKNSSGQDPAIEPFERDALFFLPELRIDMQAVLHVLRERRAVLRNLGLDEVKRFGLRNTGREIFDQRGLTFWIGRELDEFTARARVRRAF